MRIAIAGTVALLALCLFGGAHADRAGSTVTGWTTYNRSYAGERYVPLAMITPENAARLAPLCTLRLGDDGPFQTGPLVIDTTMYLTTAHTTVAIDATNCAVRWRSVYVPQESEVWIVNRGLGFLDGRLFRGTADGRLLALDARTGETLWTTRVGDPAQGEFVSAAPIAWRGLVFAGLSGSDWGVRGRVMAYDVATGREVWHFNTIPMGKETGADTWEIPASALTGGGGTWSSYTLDPRTGELFVSIANPAPDYLPDRRPGANLFTNSLVVLDAHTGKLKWWYQVTPNDSHDWDLAAAPVLFRDKRGEKRVALGSKDGHVYVIDRQTHALIYRTAVIRVENTERLPTPEGVHVCPIGQAGVHWNGPAIDVQRDRLYVGAVESCGTYRSNPAETFTPGAGYAGGGFTPDPVPPVGWLSALDLHTGRIAWRYRAAAPLVAGVTATAGGVVFTGDLAGHLLTLDGETGTVLSSIETPGAIAGGVISNAIGGRQYVAATSGNLSRLSFRTTGTPSIVILSLDAAEHRQIDIGGARDPDADHLRSLGFVDVNLGRVAYGRYCAACHGSQGEGASGPALRGLKDRRTLDETLNAIRAPRAPMPALYPATLDEQQVADIAAYIRSLR